VVFLRARIIYDQIMVKPPTRKPIPFDCPATYKITVQGWIDHTWSDRLEGMTICQATLEGGSPVTILEGELSDQAALAGVLNSIYELHLAVLLVKRLNIS
jgi:hypothetical protein